MITAEELKKIVPKSTPEQRLEKERQKLCKQVEKKVERGIIKAQKQGLNQYSIAFDYKLSQSSIGFLRNHFARLGYRTAFYPYTYSNTTDMTIYWGMEV